MKRIYLFLFLILLASIFSAYAANPNLVANPSVEIVNSGAPANWNTLGQGPYWSNEGHTGIHSLGANINTQSGNWLSDKFDLSGNTSYFLVFWVKGSYTSGTINIYLRYFDGGTWKGQDGVAVSGSYNEWTLVNITITSPDISLTQGDINFEFNGLANVTVDDFYVGLATITPEMSFLENLFFGEGFWFMLIIILAVITIAVFIVPYCGILFLVITIFLGIEYLAKLPQNSNYMWGALVMFLTPIYIIVLMALGFSRGK